MLAIGSSPRAGFRYSSSSQRCFLTVAGLSAPLQRPPSCVSSAACSPSGSIDPPELSAEACIAGVDIIRTHSSATPENTIDSAERNFFFSDEGSAPEPVAGAHVGRSNGNRTYGNRALFTPRIYPLPTRGLGRTRANDYEIEIIVITKTYLDFRAFDERRRTAAKGLLVPGRGLEPPRCYPLVPETSASTNSATRAGEEGRAMYAGGRELSN